LNLSKLPSVFILDTKYPILLDPDGHQTQNKFRYHLQMEMSLPSVLIEFLNLLEYQKFRRRLFVLNKSERPIVPGISETKYSVFSSGLKIGGL
jgi:hypothetical protein